jgi:hypothetical protein
VAEIITEDDLPVAVQSNEMVELMIAAANAKASRVAPCLTWTGAADSTTPTPTDDLLAEARLILVGAVRRWVEAGSGALSQQTETLGPYSSTQSLDTRNRTGYNLWPTEITQLQDLCKSGGEASAFTVDTAPCVDGAHLPWCSLNFGATYCSCGVDIATYPIFEMG